MDINGKFREASEAATFQRAQEAIKILSEILNQGKNVAPSTMITVLIKRAECYFSEGQHNNALMDFQEIIKLGYPIKTNQSLLYIYHDCKLKITVDDAIDDLREIQLKFIQLNALLATYFELHAVLHDWSKACQAALHMYLLNPPIWYLKSTINNLKILHKATRLRNQGRLSYEQSSITTAHEYIYSFWIDFFSEAINSNSTSCEERELPAQVPVLVFDNYEKKPETLVIRILEQQKHIRTGDLVKTIDMNSIRSIINVKRNN
ncbi:unnamed protein product [Rotaria sp. Silwood2]|nr:unnamed protein product [Rotaria sp. Silwood2]